MKKFTSFLIMFFLLLSVASSVAAEEIEIGDYLQMGTYYETPILWRCVDIDENGPLMLSDQILCLKPFDAPGTNTTGSHIRGIINYSISDMAVGAFRQENGSGYWGDSNLRCWLNSTASAGNVNWQCGNPPSADKVTYNSYDAEAGFLSRFTATERNIIRSVKQKTILNLNEYSTNPSSNLVAHTFQATIERCVQNYDDAYGEECSDRIFLPSVKQFYSIYENQEILGNYCNGIPTEAAYNNANYRNTKFSSEKVWYYWLRDAVSLDDAVVRVFKDGVVTYINAKGGHIGVRPAFYLNQASFNSLEGGGTSEDPYVTKETPLAISVSKESNSVDVTVTNTQSETTGVLYIAGYTQNGSLTNLRSQSYTSRPGTDTINILFPDTDDKIRVYYWSVNLQALCAPSSWAE